MGTSLRMRRVSADEVAKGPDHLEKQFSKTLKNRTFKKELDSGVLCSLGEYWQMVNVLLAGEDFPATGVESLPVLGGEHIATQGERVDVLLVLKPELVLAAADYLQGIDPEAQVRENKGKLRVVGGAPDWMIDALVGKFEAMRKFYLEASASGSAVAKRVYS
ncbi:DUF1877 family protein [Streptomyces sp. CA-135486]|uniref:DUF1877 family protein n=1 Tax=Streptomyces sp. CA-135486 TaxID=3240049 RepID=UPI003D8FB41E